MYEEQIESLDARLQPCRLCPRSCEALRRDGEIGECGAGEWLEIASYHAHFGEEAGLVGSRGSGTIFFSHCSLKCVFCQNFDISHQGRGKPLRVEQLAGIMLMLQEAGCHNINLVTPTHYTAQIVAAIAKAKTGGLELPIVWNTSGWERLEILQLLDGIVDIYLSDFKFTDGAKAALFADGAHSYPHIAKAALREMHRQVGVARPEEDGIIRKGLMVRHLVMPNNAAGSTEAVRWIAENISKDTYVNIMVQYRPAFRADRVPDIDRAVVRDEYAEVVNTARAAGMTNLDVQG